MHIAVMVFLSLILREWAYTYTPGTTFLLCSPFRCLRRMSTIPADTTASQHDKPGNETEQAVGGDKADNGSARRHRRPIYIPALDAQKLRGRCSPLNSG